MNKEKLTTLLNGWDDTFIFSYIQGCMGYAIADDEQNPSSALIVNGHFCFLIGEPCIALVNKIATYKIIPQNEEWEKLIETTLEGKVKKTLRYAIKKEGNIFDTKKLAAYVKLPNNEYTIKLFDEDIYKKAMSEEWSRDFCSQFADYSDFIQRGLGVAILFGDELVAGASSYIIYDDGLEIQIETKNTHRRKGIATACGAKLILECLERNIYPSWDATDLRSVSLAEKLGYHLDKPYTCYIMDAYKD